MSIGLITENELHGWVVGHEREAQGLTADLLYQLVEISAKNKSEFRFPKSDSIGQHGRDGKLATDDGYLPYVPQGKSLWEFGSGDNPQQKANDDYVKRRKALDLDERLETTFVFVTPRSAVHNWNLPAQEKWIAEKKAENAWKDVRVIDGTKLIQWVAAFPAVDAWLAKKVGRPTDGFERADDYWADLRTVGNPPPLHPEVFTTNREDACAKLKKVLDNLTNQLQIDTHSRSQATDFVAAYIATLENDERQRVTGSCLIVSSREAWKILSGLQRRHVLIADFDLEAEDTEAMRLIQRARNNNHAVIYARQPGGIPDSFSVSIPDPTVSQLQSSLEKSEYPAERARGLAQKSNGRLSVLLNLILPLATRPEWTQGTEAAELAIAELLGSWRDVSEADRAVAETLSGKEYGEWIKTIRHAANRPAAPLSQRDGIWKFNLRYDGWYELGSQIFDDHLDRFKSIAVTVLTERDPIFDIDVDDRNLARFKGIGLRHSKRIRTGISEALALLGSHPKALTSTMNGKAEYVAAMTVREVLSNNDWSVWATLNHELPLLAEAAPTQFLDVIEKFLSTNPNLFLRIFEQEGGGPMFGQTYMSGLLWALETLAWSPDYLTRVIVALGGLATIDPGGTWGNRPANSIRTILLGWLPQTCASVEGRVASVKALIREYPKVGWESLLKLLPEGQSGSSHTRRPAWREFIPNTWTARVTNKEYFAQVAQYADLAVDIVKKDVGKVSELIDRLGNLTHQARETFLVFLESSEFRAANEEVRSKVWDELSDLVVRHNRFAAADWAMPEEMLLRLTKILDLITPSSAQRRYQRLFTENDFDLIDENASYEKEDYEKSLEKIEVKRRDAVKEIFDKHGIDAVMKFSLSVRSPWRVGKSLGTLPLDTDNEVLPHLLNADEKALRQFAGGYILGRFRARSWTWVDSLDMGKWDVDQKGQFFSYLPFIAETWSRVDTALANQGVAYWSRANANPYDEKKELPTGIDRLIQYERPASAIECLSVMLYQDQQISQDQAFAALQLLLEGKEEKSRKDAHAITNIIAALQKSPTTDQDKLLRVEWSYLSLLDGHHGPVPKTLERRLSEDPQIFMDLIRLIFKSTKTEEEEEISPDRKDKAVHAYNLLQKWKTIPGIQPDGSFNESKMLAWIAEVRKRSQESGHLDVALSNLGQVLAHSPADPSGLWILEPVAVVLNERDADSIRSGFSTELYNSRGVHWGSQGAEERKLAEVYFEQANAVDKKGYQRLAATVRELGNSFVRYAEREEREDRLEG